MSSDDKIHLLSNQLKLYQQNVSSDTIEQVQYAVGDIANRVFDLEEELDQAFQAGMEYAIDLFIQESKQPDNGARRPDNLDVHVRDMAASVRSVVEAVVTEVHVTDTPVTPRVQMSKARVGTIAKPTKRVPFKGK